MTLPNIGPTLEDRIIAARDAEGGFERPEVLLDIAGTNERVLDGLRGRIRF